jgi:hypothetical protein
MNMLQTFAVDLRLSPDACMYVCHAFYTVYFRSVNMKNFQTGSSVHPTSYTMCTGSTFQGVKRLGREADHSPPTSAEVKKMWIYTSTPS